jgi:hypothetical protein
VEPLVAKDGLQFLTPTQARVGGSSCEDMLVCGTTRILGRLQGFLVDPVAHQLRYLVVRTTGLLKKTSVLPMTDARIDMGARAIQILDQDAIDRSEPFSPEGLSPFTEDQLATI